MKKQQLNDYKEFTLFLQKVVEDKSVESFNDITDLRNRFKSLQDENNMLFLQVSKLSIGFIRVISILLKVIFTKQYIIMFLETKAVVLTGPS